MRRVVDVLPQAIEEAREARDYYLSKSAAAEEAFRKELDGTARSRALQAIRKGARDASTSVQEREACTRFLIFDSLRARAWDDAAELLGVPELREKAADALRDVVLGKVDIGLGGPFELEPFVPALNSTVRESVFSSPVARHAGQFVLEEIARTRQIASEVPAVIRPDRPTRRGEGAARGLRERSPRGPGPRHSLHRPGPPGWREQPPQHRDVPEVA